MTTTYRPTEVCDECATAFYDEAPGLLEGDDILEVLELGAEIADHRCETYDDPEIACDCACRRRGA